MSSLFCFVVKVKTDMASYSVKPSQNPFTVIPFWSLVFFFFFHSLSLHVSVSFWSFRQTTIGPSHHNGFVWLLLAERTDSKDTVDWDYSSPSDDISKTPENKPILYLWFPTPIYPYKKYKKQNSPIHYSFDFFFSFRLWLDLLSQLFFCQR